MAEGESFNNYLLRELSNYENAKLFLIESVNDRDEEFLIKAIKLIIKAQGPTKISKLAGGNKQRWADLKNPTYSTISSFLKAFGLKMGVYEVDEIA